MKRLYILAGIITGLLFSVFGQPEGQATGSISGKVVDSVTNLPIEYANIVVYKPDTTLVTGSVTTGEGIFILNGVPYGRYLMKVSFIGYDDIWIDTIAVNNRNRNVHLERLQLLPSAAVLTQFQVTDRRSVLEMQIDRRVFNVDQSIVTQGQTATEVLETVPSVEVDIDGNVSLRGSGNVTILIDGRPSAMMGSDVPTALSQIPANMIESVEIITNPSARYDPEGMSGIINIKLKQDRRAGVNGVVSAGYGTWGKYNTSLNINYRTTKYNLFANYSLNNRNFFRGGSTYTINRQNPDSLFYVDQEMYMTGYRNSQMFRGGADWFLSPRSTLSAFFTVNNSRRASDDTVNTIYQDVNKDISALTDRLSNGESFGNGYNVVMTWQTRFNKPGQELLIDANYSSNQSSSEDDYMDLYHIYDYSPSEILLYDRRNTASQNNIASLQVDYTHPVTANSKLETGGRVGYRQLDDDQGASYFDTIQDEWLPNANRINNYVYEELIAAMYAAYAGKINKLSYKAGLRLEQTYTTGILRNSADTFNNQYPSLFPSVHFSWKPDKSNEFQLSYSRRITRPRNRMLNPFADYSDPMNIRQGNPYLEPEYTNSFEMGYSRFFSKSSIITSVYFRQINDQIERFKIITPEGVTIATFQNLSRGTQYGYELIGTYNPYRWWSMNANFNMYQRIIEADRIREGLGNSGMMYSVKLMSTMNLKTGTSIQISGDYSSPRVLTIGVSAPRYRMDMGVRQLLLKNRASLSLRLSDVFFTSRWSVSLDDVGFIQEIDRYFDTRVAYLTFTYQFGQQQQRENQSRRRGQRDNGNESDDSMDMIF